MECARLDREVSETSIKYEGILALIRTGPASEIYAAVDAAERLYRECVAAKDRYLDHVKQHHPEELASAKGAS